VVILYHRAQRLPAQRHGEGDDRGVPAAGRRDAPGAEVVGRLDAPVGLLVEVAVAVDAAGQDEHIRGVDLVCAGSEIAAQRRYPAAPHAHVAADRIGRGHHRAAPDYQIERRHPSPSRAPDLSPISGACEKFPRRAAAMSQRNHA